MLREPGPLANLEIRELPMPIPQPGWIRIRVKAFGLNRSELHTRLGLAQGVTFPRVLGIEATGVVDDPGDSGLAAGTQVATMMANGVRLTAYGGESSDLPSDVLQKYLDAIASGQRSLGPVQTYTLDEIRAAHDDMENNRAIGKQVVVL